MSVDFLHVCGARGTQWRDKSASWEGGCLLSRAGSFQQPDPNHWNQKKHSIDFSGLWIKSISFTNSALLENSVLQNQSDWLRDAHSHFSICPTLIKALHCLFFSFLLFWKYILITPKGQMANLTDLSLWSPWVTCLFSKVLIWSAFSTWFINSRVELGCFAIPEKLIINLILVSQVVLIFLAGLQKTIINWNKCFYIDASILYSRKWLVLSILVDILPFTDFLSEYSKFNLLNDFSSYYTHKFYFNKNRCLTGINKKCQKTHLNCFSNLLHILFKTDVSLTCHCDERKPNIPSAFQWRAAETRNDRGRARTILTGRWLLQLEEKEQGHMLVVPAHAFEPSCYLFSHSLD